MSGVLGYLNMIVLQIYHRVWQWKNFENQLSFGVLFFDSRCTINGCSCAARSRIVTGLERIRQHYSICSLCSADELAECRASVNDPRQTASVRESQDFLRICVRRRTSPPSTHLWSWSPPEGALKGDHILSDVPWTACWSCLDVRRRLGQNAVYSPPATWQRCVLSPNHLGHL